MPADQKILFRGSVQSRASHPGLPLTLQNILLKQVHFPAEIKKNEYVAEFWADKLPKEVWAKALFKIVSTTNTVALWLPSATDDSFLAMAQTLVGRTFKVTGAITIRYTDNLTNRAIFRVIAVGIGQSHRRTYDRNEGPHVSSELMGGWRGPNECIDEVLGQLDWLGRVG